MEFHTYPRERAYLDATVNVRIIRKCLQRAGYARYRHQIRRRPGKRVEISITDVHPADLSRINAELDWSTARRLNRSYIGGTFTVSYVEPRKARR